MECINPNRLTIKMMKAMNRSSNYESAMQCTVCKSRGLPESVWKSHNVRKTPHPESMVTCPTILNNKCSHCKEIGHLVSRCPVLKMDEKYEKRVAYKERVESFKAKPKTVVVSETPKNAFAALMEDSDSEVEDCVEPVVLKRVQKTMTWSDVQETIVLKKRPFNWADADSDSEDE